MYIGGIIKSDIANGPGIRLSIFVSGCNIHCPECFNKEAQNFEYGQMYTKDLEDEIIKELSHEYYDGLSILGGEPFEYQNQEGLLPLILRVKKELPEKTIWMYTGYQYNIDLIFRYFTEDHVMFYHGSKYMYDITDRILDNIDVLVDGPFKINQKDITLKFRGSRNQRIIDMKKTRKNKEYEVILVDELM